MDINIPLLNRTRAMNEGEMIDHIALDTFFAMIDEDNNKLVSFHEFENAVNTILLPEINRMEPPERPEGLPIFASFSGTSILRGRDRDLNLPFYSPHTDNLGALETHGILNALGGVFEYFSDSLPTPEARRKGVRTLTKWFNRTYSPREPAPAANGNADEGFEVCFSCQRDLDSIESSVKCQSCGTWFHYGCVSEIINSFVGRCPNPNCQKLMSHGRNIVRPGPVFRGATLGGKRRSLKNRRKTNKKNKNKCRKSNVIKKRRTKTFSKP